MTADDTSYSTPHTTSSANGGDSTTMAPLPSAQKTPKNKRHPSSGNGPVIPSVRNQQQMASMHGSSFTEHRSQVDIPDTPLNEGRAEARTEGGDMEGNVLGTAENSARSSLDIGFAMPTNSTATSDSQRSGSSFSSPVPQRPTTQQPPMMSPWQHLAATGGAMTPSVERPGGEAISPFFAAEFGSAGAAQSGSSAGGFPGFNLALPQPNAAPPSGFAFPLGSTAPRSHSPHLGGPFAQLTLGSGTTSRAPPSGFHAGTPGVAPMSDPFLSIPHPNATLNVGSPPSTSHMTSKSPPTASYGEGGSRDAVAAAMAARRRGSRSGPSGLSQSVHAEDPSPSQQPTSDPKPTSTLPSGPVSSGMRLKMPLGTGIGYRKSSLGASSPSTSSPPCLAALPEAMGPSELAARMHDKNTHLLILDLRQPSAFTAGHAAHAVSLPIPSTLLKRQAFTLDKLLAMLPRHSAQAVGTWRDMSDVVIVDQDSTAAASGSIIAGMANKFRAAQSAEQGAWQGKVWFLRGGMSACRNTREVDLAYGAEDEEENEVTGDENKGAQADGPDAGSGQSASVGSNASSLGKTNKLFGGLSRAAFQQGSIKGMQRKRAGAPQSIAMPKDQGPIRLDLRGTGYGRGESGNGGISKGVLTNGSNASAHSGGSAGPDSGGRGPASGNSDSPRTGTGEGDILQPANPFFDNIRQNLELSHGGITERISLNLPPEVASRAHELPAFLRDLVEKPSNETAAILANEFENVERDEQKRLQSIMEWHSRGLKHIDEAFKVGKANRKKDKQRRMSFQSEADRPQAEERAAGKVLRVQRTQSGMVQVKSAEVEDQSEVPEDYFPFSITAGVERGAKNRYKNIWPYDFSRVRLTAKCHDDGSDYINANYIQPQGTTKRYIATQGPLNATFQDFWTLVWEQHVDVIVMLTKQYEAGSIKCGSYWTDGTYGPLHLQLLSTAGGEDAPEQAVSGFDFHVGTDKPATGTPNIRRTFLLSHAEYPNAPPRKITQIQCVTWPDFDVPEDPHTLLGLVKEVDQASKEMAADAEEDQSHRPPVLVHCSAGVGRTGSYIVVDAMLDALRREHHAHHRKIRGTSQGLSKRRQSRQYEQNLMSPETARRSSDGQAVPFSSAEVPVGAFMSPSLSPPVHEGTSPFTPFPALQAFTFSPPKSSMAEHMDIDRSHAEEHPASHLMRRIPEEANGRDGQQESQEYNLMNEIESIPKITARRKEVLDPSPVLEKSQPVKSILSNMRVQRMSLCQSLRQYLFVYRAIIIGYLDMLDEEKEIEQELHGSGSSLNNLVSRTNNHSATTTDEENQVKRRAPDIELGGSSLTKRPSLKSFGSKRRARNVNGSDESRLSAPNSFGTASSTSSTLPRPLNPTESDSVSSTDPKPTTTLGFHTSTDSSHDMDTS